MLFLSGIKFTVSLISVLLYIFGIMFDGIDFLFVGIIFLIVFVLLSMSHSVHVGVVFLFWMFVVGVFVFLDNRLLKT